jgi:uncharacterized protein YggE
MKTASHILTPVFVLGALLALSFPWSAHAQDKGRVRSITVTGRGEFSAKPDLAEIDAGVVTQAATAAAALDQNSEKMQKVLEGLTASAIAKKDIQTSRFSISPLYHRPKRGSSEGRKIVGYRVVNQVRVKIRDIDRLGRTLDRLVRLGANQLNGVRFSISKPEPLLDKARVKAMKEARRKAELLTEAGGAKVGRILSIHENGRQAPRPVFAARAEMAQSVPIAPGEQTLSVNVLVIYEID